MGDTFTTNLHLTKPDVGASDDTWGIKLNTNFDMLDAAIAAAGSGSGSGNVTGPASAVDSNIAVYNGTTGKIIKDGGSSIANLVIPPATVPPLMNGSAAVGVGVKYAREDHIHPSDTSKLADAPNDGSLYGRKSQAW